MSIKPKDLFGFADQEKITYGLGCTVSLKRNNSNDAIIRTAAVYAAKIDKDIAWYIPHYVPSMKNQQPVMKQILDKTPTELYYTERIIFRNRKDVNTENNWTFE